MIDARVQARPYYRPLP
ncbi:hypothetical protein [Caulobacter segnis]